MGLERWRLAALLFFLLVLAPSSEALAAPATKGAVAARASFVIAVVDILIVTALVARKADVRLVLVLGAFPLFLTAGKLPLMINRLAGEMANLGTVVPICSALGFAHVLRLTGCDQHLVQLLLRPLRRARFLLIPGGIAAGYLVNTAIVSQTGTAAVIGPILVPLLRAGGVSAVTAGSLLLLGSSMGGELFNPGAVEIRKLAGLTGLDGTAIVARSAWLNVLACSTALLVYWLQSVLRARKESRTEDAEPAAAKDIPPFRVNLVKAAVPLLPLVLLFASSTFLHTHVPKEIDGPATILAAMLVGVVAAGLTTPGAAGKLSTAFFEGAGYAYTHVISLIVVATVYAEGVRESGLIAATTAALLPWPSAALLVSIVVPWFLAVVSGTGIAPAVSVMEFFVPEASAMGLDPVRLGTVTAMGAHFGRTMSPAAAVVTMSARLTETTPGALIRRVVLPLLAGGLVLFLAALLKSL